ncbi:heat-shock protein HtpX [Haloarcula taiwanensis]|uniref:Heat-shock protein HtpX n=1 Tax=Haloarcula taiwanensis TaxID=1932004 RepID=A0A2H4ZUT8_9EURY|nr:MULTISPECIES: M48 family metalloprotease [Haloarcula]AUG46243.1 heat-shock protein HtpX [Haloarcula taiwanensis]RLM36464.1 heat-shock protein HtpX [Haloarcula sp. Atlit-120R]RLM45154.1 heat-shock protein HtpX [Haloarcula sp. Atlit-47R]
MAVTRRLLVGIVGLVSLLVYLMAAYVGYVLLLPVWNSRPSPLLAALVILGTAIVLGILNYWAATAQLKRSLDAVELSRTRAPELHRRLDGLVDQMDVDTPTLLLAELPVPNAFAIGGGAGAIVLDRRLFQLLSPAEFEALLGHELAHLETRDALVQTVAYSLVQTLVGLVGLVLFPIVVLVGGVARSLALVRGDPSSWSRSWLGRTQRYSLQVVAGLGFAVTLLILSYSRRRELAADDRAVEVTGNPVGLARALVKIEQASKPDPGLLRQLYVHGETDSNLSRLLSTHPPMDERIQRLQERVQGNSMRARELSNDRR